MIAFLTALFSAPVTFGDVALFAAGCFLGGRTRQFYARVARRWSNTLDDEDDLLENI